MRIPILSRRKAAKLAKALRCRLTRDNADGAASRSYNNLDAINRLGSVTREGDKILLEKIHSMHQEIKCNNANAQRNAIVRHARIEAFGKMHMDAAKVSDANFDMIGGQFTDLERILDEHCEEFDAKMQNHGTTLWKLKRGVGNLFKDAKKVVGSLETTTNVLGDIVQRVVTLEAAMSKVDTYVAMQEARNKSFDKKLSFVVEVAERCQLILDEPDDDKTSS